MKKEFIELTEFVPFGTDIAKGEKNAKHTNEANDKTDE